MNNVEYMFCLKNSKIEAEMQDNTKTNAIHNILYFQSS